MSPFISLRLLIDVSLSIDVCLHTHTYTNVYFFNTGILSILLLPISLSLFLFHTHSFSIWLLSSTSKNLPPSLSFQTRFSLSRRHHNFLFPSHNSIPPLHSAFHSHSSNCPLTLILHTQTNSADLPIITCIYPTQNAILLSCPGLNPTTFHYKQAFASMFSFSPLSYSNTHLFIYLFLFLSVCLSIYVSV